MREFRVFNRVRRVGVEWPLLGLKLQNWSVAVLGGVIGICAATAGIAYLVLGLAALVPIGIASLIILAIVVNFFARLRNMGMLSHKEQSLLIYRTVKEPVHINFVTPDFPDDDRTLAGPHAAIDTIYRNY